MYSRHKTEKTSAKQKVTDLRPYLLQRAHPPTGSDNPPTRATNANVEARKALVVDHLLSHATTNGNAAVAVAIVLLRPDGTLDLSATGVDLEYTGLIATALEQLASSLRRRRAVRKSKTRDHGFGSLYLIAAIGFMAATYINEYAWLDAALSLFAQLAASRYGRRASDIHSR